MPALYWLGIAALLLVIEIATLGLTTIWFALGALVAALVSYIGIGIIGQVLLFVIVSGVSLAVTRPLAMKYLNNRTIRTNADSLIGKVAIVTEEIDNIAAKGAAKIQGEEWMARSQQDDVIVKEGEKVKVLQISGVKLIVEPIEENR